MNNAKVFLIILFINLLTHLPFIHLPPCGSHVWRQCNTLSMARNFHQESMNILEPRIDRRNETNGITGSHFPLYEWGLAAIYQLTGEYYWVPRLYSLLLFSIGIFAFYLLLIEFQFKKQWALIGALFLSTLPQLYYDGLNAMPDIEALSFSLLSLLYFYKFSYNERRFHLILGSAFAMLAGLIKIQFLIGPLAFSLFNSIRSRQFWMYILSVSIASVPVVLWYRYAQRLTEASNLREYGLWIKSIGWQRTYDTLVKNLSSDLPELLLGWPLLLTFIYVLSKTITQSKHSRFSAPYAAWMFGFTLFYLVVRERFYDHSYYFISILPLLVLVFMQLFAKSKIQTSYLMLLLVLNSIWSLARIIPSRWTEKGMQISAVFKDPQQLERLKRRIPSARRYIVGPDISGCIYFYFLDVKGYSFATPEEILEKEEGQLKLEKYHEQGADYLIVSDKEALAPLILRTGKWVLYSEVDEFAIWRHE